MGGWRRCGAAETSANPRSEPVTGCARSGAAVNRRRVSVLRGRLARHGTSRTRAPLAMASNPRWPRPADRRLRHAEYEVARQVGRLRRKGAGRLQVTERVLQPPIGVVVLPQGIGLE
jgi:hypothetical protein